MKCSEEKKFQDLETLAEQWLKLRPDSIQTIAYIATASKELGHNEKWIQSLIALYKRMPTGSLANEIAQAYNKTKNKAKYLEWTELALKYPEFETDFRTRLSLVQFFADEKNPSKAVEYAQAAIKAADVVKNPSTETKATAAHGSQSLLRHYWQNVARTGKVRRIHPGFPAGFWFGKVERKLLLHRTLPPNAKKHR